MKVFAFAIVLAIVAAVHAQNLNLNEQQTSVVNNVGSACRASTGAEYAAVAAFGEGNFNSPSESSKCFAKCYIESLNFVKNAVLQKEVILNSLKNVIGPNNAQIVVDICDKIKGEDNCDTGLEIYKCNYYVRTALLTKNGFF